MKTRNLLAIVSSMVMIIAGSAQAADLYWSANGSILGGAGTWNTSSATNWGSTMAGPFGNTWVNANKDIARFGSTAGAVALGATIDVGGLKFDTTAYPLTTTGFTLNFAATDNTITLNNIAAATITGPVGGSGNVTLTAANPATAGTVTFTGTSTAGWSGSTTINPGMTLSVDGANQVLLNTTGITINGGALLYGNILTAQNTINFINDNAPITFNGGGSYTWKPVNASTFNETNGAVTVNSGQANLMTGTQSGPGIATLTLAGLTRSDVTSALSLSTGNGSILTGTATGFNRIKVTGAGSTAGWTTNMVGTPIIGPWATTGTSSADYAVYTNDYVAAGAGADTSNDSNWTDATKAYTLNTGSALTINSTHTITALRFYGAASTLALGMGSLETYGLLFTGANSKIVTNTVGALTTPAGGGNLFITTIGANHTIFAPINNNGGAVTLVKSGANTLTLSSTTSTYSGGTVINAGTLTYTADASLGASGSRNLTFNGNATLTGFSGSSLGQLSVGSGGVANINAANITFATTTGSGTIIFGSAAVVQTLTLGDASGFTGNILNLDTYAGVIIAFSKLNDSGTLRFAGGSSDSNQRVIFQLSGDAGSLTLDTRQVQLLDKGGYANANRYFKLQNSNTTAANKWVINTPLLNNVASRAIEFELGGSNTGNNEFRGTIGNGANSISLTKADGGTWLLSGTNTYSGATSVSAGKLVGVVGGSCSNSAVTVSAGTLGISVTDNTMSWICKALTHTAASTLEFAFGGNPPSTTVAPLQVNGNVVFAVAPAVSCTGSSLPAGTYPLVKWTGVFIGVAPSTLTLPSGTGILVFDNANKTLWLSISASGGSKQPLTWKGPAGSIWVANGSVYTNWQDATTPTPVNTNYQETAVNGITVGDNVVFGTTGAGTVTLNTTVSPASVAVNTTANYTFSGTGSIAGPGGLTKANSGTLTLSTVNSYSGGTLLSAGTLSIATNNALGTGPLVLGAGTIQSSDATARTLSNPVVLNGNSTVGGTGNLTINGSGAGTLAANSQITVSGSSVNATFGTSFGGAFTLTKAGLGTMTLTGTNTYTGTTTVNAGSLVVNGGQITNNAAVTSSGISSIIITNGGKVFCGGAASTIGTSGTNTMVIAGGSGVASLWNLGNQHLAVGGANAGDKNRLVIDGAGVAGSAVVTNINQLQYNGGTAFSSANTSIILTNGGQMFVNGIIRLGSTYYGTYNNANNSITIMGGAADSMFVGNNQSFYVGYGDRYNSRYNNVTVGAGSVLTNVGTFYVGDSENTQGVAGAPQSSYFNQLVVADGGKAFLRSDLNVGYATVYTVSNNTVLVSNGGLLSVPGALSVGYANAANTTGTFNSVTITSGGQFFTGADSMIGRATASGTVANNNTAWVGGTNSLWNLGGKKLIVGSATTGGVATGNVLSVSAGGMATNISALIVSVTNTLSLGAGGLIFAGAVTNSGTMAVGLDKNVTPASGRMTVTGNLNVSNAMLDVSLSGTLTSTYVVASYGSLTGAFAATNGLSNKYKLEMNYKGLNQIAIVYNAAGTLIRIF